MIARRFAYPLLVLLALAGCNVNSTVGYNEGALVNGVWCQDDALSRCDDGVCAVTNLFEAPHGAITLAVDDTNLYFLSSQLSIDRRPIDGGPSLELARTSSPLMRMASDATHVYWTEQNGDVRGVSKAGGERFDAGYVFGNPTDIALDATHLYWIFPEFGQVAMAPKPSGAASHISGQAAPQAITTDRTHVYWVNAGSGAATGQLVRAVLGDLTSAEVVLSGLEAPVAIAVSDDAVYWASDTAVFRLLKGESTAQTVTTGLTDLKGIGVRGQTVYGVGGEGLWKVPAAGGEWQQLERRPMSGMAMACSGVFGAGWYEEALVRYGP